MVEGDHAGTTSGAAEVVKVGVVAQHHVCGHLSSGRIECSCQQAYRLPQLDRFGLHHSGKLAIAHHRHNGHPGGVCAHIVNSVREISHALNYSDTHPAR